MNRSRRATLAAVTTLLLTVWIASPAESARAARSSSSSSVNRSPNASASANRSGGGNANRANANASANRNANANVNRNANVNSNTNVNRNVNYNSDVNINRDVNVDSDYHGGCCGCCYNEHPVAGAMAVTAAVSLTAAAIGSIVSQPPANCVPVVVNGLTYQQCGSTWYQPQMSSGATSYVVVNPPQ